MTHWPSFLRELDAAETAWNTRLVHYPREDAVPFLPYPMPQFISLLAEAVKAAPPAIGVDGQLNTPRLLDIGCGVGVKLRLATAMFGLDCYGIDIVPDFIAEAQAKGVQAIVADAFQFPEGGRAAFGFDGGYAAYQICYLNRPSAHIEELETLIMDRMASRSVLMMVNGRCDPGKAGWLLVSQEWGEPTVGCWIKP
jgi:SAM-dependent methyltransferase